VGAAVGGDCALRLARPRRRSGDNPENVPDEWSSAGVPGAIGADTCDVRDRVQHSQYRITQTCIIGRVWIMQVCPIHVSQTTLSSSDAVSMLPLILGAVGVVAWMLRPRRPSEPGFPFVLVRQDGTVRELSAEERNYLSETFAPGDSGRPYVKMVYEGRDLWGSQSGFIRRRDVPARLVIEPVHPDYDARMRERPIDPLAANREVGDILTTNADGSILCTPNPALSRLERFTLLRRHHMAEERAREALARVEPTNEDDAPAG
jgi:hypothetical protein